MYFNPGTKEETFTPDGLIGGDFPIVTRAIVVKKGEVLARGSLVGKAKDGKYVLSIASKKDGSEIPRGILVDDVDATKADVKGAIYKTGTFNVNYMTIGEGHSLEDLQDLLDEKSLFLVKGVE